MQLLTYSLHFLRERICGLNYNWIQKTEIQLFL